MIPKNVYDEIYNEVKALEDGYTTNYIFPGGKYGIFIQYENHELFADAEYTDLDGYLGDGIVSGIYDEYVEVGKRPTAKQYEEFMDGISRLYDSLSEHVALYDKCVSNICGVIKDDALEIPTEIPAALDKSELCDAYSDYVSKWIYENVTGIAMERTYSEWEKVCDEQLVEFGTFATHPDQFIINGVECRGFDIDKDFMSFDSFIEETTSCKDNLTTEERG